MYLCFEHGLRVQEGLGTEIKIQMDVTKDDTFVNMQILISHSSSPPTEIRF